MHPKISVNTLSLAPAPFDRQIETISALGAQGTSPDLIQLEAFGLASSIRTLRDSGLETVTLTHRSFAFATSEQAELGRDRLNRTIEVAAEIGAMSVLLTTGGCERLSFLDATNRFAETIAPCVEHASAAGVTLCIEPTSHLYADASFAHRFSDTSFIAEKAGINVAIDLFACWFDSDIESAIAQFSQATALVQVSDYIHADRSLPCRAVPGDGAIPLDRLVAAILRAGYTGWFDLEIIGPRLQAEGQEAGLLRAGEFVGRMIEQGADTNG